MYKEKDFKVNAIVVVLFTAHILTRLILIHFILYTKIMKEIVYMNARNAGVKLKIQTIIPQLLVFNFLLKFVLILFLIKFDTPFEDKVSC